MTRLGGLAIGVVAWVAVAPAAARANCALPASYQVSRSGTTVRVCPDFFGAPAPRTCPDEGLLRVSASGEVVLVTTCDGDRCFVDECVPGGTHEYGLRTPFACGHTCGPSDLYATVVVPAAGGECQRTVAAPAAYAGAVPWTFGGDPAVPCPGRAGYVGGCGTTGAAGVLSLNAAVLAAGALLWRARARRGPRRG